MSDSTPPPNTETKEKPKRNPTERIIVWGVIGVMIIVASAEAVARYGYTTTLPILQARMVEDDAGADARSLTLAEADKLIAGYPSRTEESDKVIYRWKGLVKDHGAIHLAFDNEKTIIGLETDAPPEISEPVLPPTVESEIEDPMGSMPGGGLGSGGGASGEGGGPGGGGRNFDPMQFDADGDGKISLEEAPERMKSVFDQIDANSDGFADAAEFEARRAARQQERSEGEGGRPQRPNTDEATPAGNTPTSTPEPLGTEAKPKAAAETKPEVEAKPEAEAKPAPKEE